jgi:hypothetical protein
LRSRRSEPPSVERYGLQPVYHPSKISPRLHPLRQSCFQLAVQHSSTEALLSTFSSGFRFPRSLLREVHLGAVSDSPLAPSPGRFIYTTDSVLFNIRQIQSPLFAASLITPHYENRQPRSIRSHAGRASRGPPTPCHPERSVLQRSRGTCFCFASCCGTEPKAVFLLPVPAFSFPCSLGPCLCHSLLPIP